MDMGSSSYSRLADYYVFGENGAKWRKGDKMVVTLISEFEFYSCLFFENPGDTNLPIFLSLTLLAKFT